MAFQLTTITDNDFAITFPSNIKFEVLCYLVNYLVYPDNIMWGSDVTGWTTIEHGDKWVTEKTVNKKVMIFIPEGDRNGGSVFLTLIDGLSIRISFDYDEYNNLPPKEAGWDDSYQIKILKKPIKKYTQPTIDMFLLKDNQKEYFS